MSSTLFYPERRSN